MYGNGIYKCYNEEAADSGISIPALLAYSKILTWLGVSRVSPIKCSIIELYVCPPR